MILIGDTGFLQVSKQWGYNLGSGSTFGYPISFTGFCIPIMSLIDDRAFPEDSDDKTQWGLANITLTSCRAWTWQCYNEEYPTINIFVIGK